jgi:hypothetical protein
MGPTEFGSGVVVRGCLTHIAYFNGGCPTWQIPLSLAGFSLRGMCAMNQIPLPLWIVSKRDGGTPPVHPPCDDQNSTLAFTAPQRLTDFLGARTVGTWHVTLINDYATLMLTIADLHSEGQLIMCLDCGADGSRGIKIYLADFIEANAIKPPKTDLT